MNRKVKNGEMEEIPAGCGDCSACGNSCCSSKSFFDMSVDNKKKKQRLLLKKKQRINRKGKDYERINIINYQCRYC